MLLCGCLALTCGDECSMCSSGPIIRHVTYQMSPLQDSEENPEEQLVAVSAALDASDGADKPSEKLFSLWAKKNRGSAARLCKNKPAPRLLVAGVSYMFILGKMLIRH